MTTRLELKPITNDIAREREEQASWDLERLVTAMRSARNTQGQWWREEARRQQRPSRDALIGIVTGLRAALFPTHFGVCDCSSDASVDFFVGNTLDATLRALEEQARRSLSCTPNRAPNSSCSEDAQRIVRAFAASLPRVRTALEQDIAAAYEGDPAAYSRSEVLFCYPGITAIMHHRLAHELYQLGLPMLARVLAEVAHSNTGIDIHPGARIAEGLFIDHGTGVVIGETAVIGQRVRIYQNVTLGARNYSNEERGTGLQSKARHPIIEDDVVIYAGATILGRVTIGRGSVIGGNVWLTHSLQPHTRITQAQARDEFLDEGEGA